MASFQKYTTKEGVRWLYKYYGEINPETGKKRQSTKRGFKTKKEAQLDAAQIEREVADGSFVAQDKITTFQQVYEQWYETNSPNFKPSTKKAVLSKFKRQLLPHFGAIKMRDITRSYCQEVINKMSKEIKTIDNMKMYANQIFEYAIRMDIRTNNPMKGVVIPMKENDHLADEDGMDRNFWEKHEIKKFLSLAKTECSQRDHLMFHLLIYTGARKGEILALRWNDIDFRNKHLSLNKTLFQDKTGFMSLTSKTAASRRVLSLDDTSIGLLRKRRSEQNRGIITPIGTTDDRLIFAREDETPIRLAYPNDKLSEIIRLHKLHPVTVHGLRHTHASLLFEAGASIKEVQERLGHSDIKMTMNIYTHVTKSAKEKTADRFEKFMELDEQITGSDVVTNGQDI
ncbi:site-specific integrase [Paenibacillus odorifer]|uniref:Site-specific integrase n=1 Tax=Paenibacillus odorifer TaxID=189426 RepID=A0A1R0X167_9BACL|nr:MULTISPECIES: site-specific integrase [Paenibacillus]ETT61868.1 Lambda integrase-like protein(Phage) [Paenibacillus sp. FSL H8-237]OMD26547.1 site-specific integrase [Paenibacillus odorifer]OME49966.1 site-specific integrase [Paenibacillus odorifer]